MDGATKLYGGGGLRIQFSEIGGPTRLGSMLKKIFEIIRCKRAQKHLPN